MRIHDGCKVKYIGDATELKGRHGTVLGKSTLLKGGYMVAFNKDAHHAGWFQHCHRWELEVTSRTFKYRRKR